MANDTCSVTSCGCELKTPSLQKNYIIWRILRVWSLIQEQFQSFGQKINCTVLPALEKNGEEQKTLHCTKLTWTLLPAWEWTKENLKEAFRWKLSDTCKRRALQSRLLKSIFVQSCLLITSSLTLAGPPRSRQNSMPHWFPQTFMEKLFWKLRNLPSKIILNEGDFLLSHDVKKIENSLKRFFFWYSNVNGVQPER